LTNQDSTAAVTLGEGALTWPRGERVSDRYGTVGLMATGQSYGDYFADYAFVDVHQVPEGSRGRLRATVLETRDSGHIGDLFRGLFPTTPEVGEVIDLGSGVVFYERVEDAPYIGLRPDDGRTSDWLDPQALYRTHEQTVRLEFIHADA
jgi:hypothetical protein